MPVSVIVAVPRPLGVNVNVIWSEPLAKVCTDRTTVTTVESDDAAWTEDLPVVESRNTSTV